LVGVAANAMTHPFGPEACVAKVKEDMQNVYLPDSETWVPKDREQPIGFIATIGGKLADFS
jgi:hypothetical protein